MKGKLPNELLDNISECDNNHNTAKKFSMWAPVGICVVLNLSVGRHY